MAKRGSVVLWVSMVVSGLMASSVAVQAAPPQVTAGQMYYKQYCATCHGVDARGDGPTAKALKEKVPDLTTLAKRNDGKFPYILVLDIIDGQQPIPSHGSAEMPTWGETFQSDVGNDPLSQAAVRGRLMLLTDYIRSIQVK
ncbi:cytochrome c [Candidatus Binatia bacterium]|nr:cytochrome c [Candidatus Binatia bacterium]